MREEEPGPVVITYESLMSFGHPFGNAKPWST